jgi:hypothetical protein
MNDESENENRKNREPFSWARFFVGFLKYLGVTLGIIAVIVVLVFGLALGACFLAARK